VIISLTAIDRQGQTREFAYHPDRIELGFDVVSLIATQNTTLIKVELIDQGHYMPLPIEVFDGASLATPIQKLEQEWTYLLEQPLQTTKQPNREEFLNWSCQQVYRYEKYIMDLNQMIDVFTKLIQETENVFSFREPSSRKADHFRRMLERYELKRTRASAAYEIAVERINTLVDQSYFS